MTDAVCHVIEQHGIPCWIAPRDMQPGASYAAEIVNGIKNCQVMVLVYSKESNKSKHVANEVDIAFNEGKTIIPFLVDDTPMNDEFSYFLARKHWLVAYPKYEEKLENLAKSVANVLGIELTDHKAERMVSMKGSLLEWPYLDPTIQNGKFGYTDSSGSIIIPCQWKFADEFHGRCALIQDYNNLYGFINGRGKLISSCQWKNALPFSIIDQLAPVQNNEDKWGFIDNSGNLIISCQWKNVLNFNMGLAPVQNSNDKWGYIDRDGRVTIPFVWQKAYVFSEEGLALVQDNNEKCGYINRMGEITIPCQWNYANHFCDGLAIVRSNNGKFGYIDITGKIVIPCQWDSAWDFDYDGLAVVWNEGVEYKIDKTGKIVE